MFEFVRSHKRLLQFLLVILIFPSFVFFGVQGYTSFQDASMTAVAVVDGRDVTRGEWEQAHQRGVDRMRQQMPGVDAKLLDTPAMRQQTLDALVRDRVLVSAAVQDHLMPGILELTKLGQHDGVPQVQVRSGRVDAQLHPERTVEREQLGQPPLRKALDRSRGEPAGFIDAIPAVGLPFFGHRGQC